ncbi:MAG: hypothetical protein AAF721_39795 [Myxococcota bacterium]
MVILSTLLLSVVSGSPSAPPPVAHTPTAPAADPAHTRHARSTPRKDTGRILDPFVAPGPRVALAPRATELQDPFTAPNLAARFRTTAPAKPALQDPFHS